MRATAEAILGRVTDNEATDAVLDALWGQVIERWDEEAVHGAALEHAVRAQRLPDLASRYRALADDAARGPIAKRQLDAIVVAATTMLMTLQTPRAPKIPLSITLSAFGICAALLALLGWAMWGKR
jgi:hypothetical protein